MNDGGSAFPRPYHEKEWGHTGMSLRDYAAIKLRVPQSGLDWLDEMIREAKRDEFAGLALNALVGAFDAEALAGLQKAGVSGNEMNEMFAAGAYELADAMLAERAKGADHETSA